jgi:hypothetical protein
MTKKIKPGQKRARNPRPAPVLSLLVEPVEQGYRNVNAEHFFASAERWLKALQAFASDAGRRVTWEIVELKKSSAFVQVRPVEPQTRKPVPALARQWEAGVRQLEQTGRPPEGFKINSLGALQEFVKGVSPDAAVTLGNGSKKKSILITAQTQRRVEEAVAAASSGVPLEYSVRGKLRGRLAVLNSWDQDDRSFRLQILLAPGKPVICGYKDNRLVTELGYGFEGIVEVEGLLHYRREGIWPYKAEIDRIYVLTREQTVSLKDLVGLLRLPEGQDSVSYIRRVRDAE